MRRFVVVLAIMCVLFGGCKYLNSFLCTPTAAQTEGANVGLALVQAALTAASVFVGGGAVVTALTQFAIPTFQKVKDGYCATQAEWDAATTALDQAQASTKALDTPALTFVKSVRW